MLPLIRAARFEADLVAIWRYIAKDNPAAATRTLEKIDQRVVALSRHPLLGERQPQFGNNTRRIIEGSYLIYYDVMPDAVHVLRVFHGARKIEELLE